jgi:MFS family permease
MRFFEKGEFSLLWRLYLGNFLICSFYLVSAFSLVYFIGLGLSLTQAGFLLGAMSMASIIFEIPTGAIADKYGRKFSVLLGLVLETICVFLIFFFKNYYMLLIIFFFFGAVGTLHSGAGESWIYDLIVKKNKKILKSYYSKIQFFSASGLIISGFIGAFIVSRFGISWIWIASGAASILYFIMIFRIPEIYTIKKEHIGGLKKIWNQSIVSIKYSLRHKVIFWLLLSGFFMIFSVVFAESLGYVPYLKGLGMPDHYFGYFFSGMSLVLALAPLVIKFFKTKSKEINYLIATTLIGSVILLFVYFAINYIQAVLIILISLFFFGIKYPIEQPFLNRFIPTKMRATVLSFKSMVYSLAGVIALPLGGFLIDKFGPLNMIIVSALLGIPCIVAYWMVKK